ncbi:hypothetical protein [Elizabethkingia anophelis]|uniref:hypothetical protein n=1 Tax=Elizabethkingia anophelis TaxID=1117645 RepID=UPI00301E0C24
MKNYILTIENPCQKANWATMNSTETGKFCSLCEKNVVDFSVLTDAEIIITIQNPQRDICAKLSLSQSNRVLGEVPKNNFRISKTLSALLIIGTTETAFSQSTEINQPPTVVVSNNHKTNEIPKLSDKSQPSDSLKNVISGKIIEEYTNELVTETPVYIKNTQIVAMTDSLGNFKMQLPDNFTADTIVLVVDRNGWESNTETIVYRKDLPISNLTIIKKGVMVGEYTIKIKRKWWQFWRKKYY